MSFAMSLHALPTGSDLHVLPSHSSEGSSSTPSPAKRERAIRGIEFAILAALHRPSLEESTETREVHAVLATEPSQSSPASTTPFPRSESQPLCASQFNANQDEYAATPPSAHSDRAPVAPVGRASSWRGKKTFRGVHVAAGQE